MVLYYILPKNKLRWYGYVSQYSLLLTDITTVRLKLTSFI